MSFHIWGVCRKIASFKIFVVVIPKEGLADGALLLLAWHRQQMCNLYPSQIIWYSQCHTKRRNNWALPVNLSFDMTSKIFKKTCFCGTCLISLFSNIHKGALFKLSTLFSKTSIINFICVVSNTTTTPTPFKWLKQFRTNKNQNVNMDHNRITFNFG